MGYIAEKIRAALPNLRLYEEGDSGIHDYTCNAILMVEPGKPKEERAEEWYFNWLHEFLEFGREVPKVFYCTVDGGNPPLTPKERQSIRLMLMCFAALQAEDDGV